MLVSARIAITSDNCLKVLISNKKTYTIIMKLISGCFMKYLYILDKSELYAATNTSVHNKRAEKRN